MGKLEDAFCGLLDESPIVVNVKFKEKRIKIFIAFGEIIIPRLPKERSVLPKLEDKFKCKIKIMGFTTRITPNIVEEIIQKDGALSTADSKHVEALRSWFEEHGRNVIGALLHIIA